MDTTKALTEVPAQLTSDEKAYAGLSHALVIVTWWIGPLIIFLTKKESRFKRFSGRSFSECSTLQFSLRFSSPCFQRFRRKAPTPDRTSPSRFSWDLGWYGFSQ